MSAVLPEGLTSPLSTLPRASIPFPPGKPSHSTASMPSSSSSVPSSKDVPTLSTTTTLSKFALASAMRASSLSSVSR